MKGKRHAAREVKAERLAVLYLNILAVTPMLVAQRNAEFRESTAWTINGASGEVVHYYYKPQDVLLDENHPHRYHFIEKFIINNMQRQYHDYSVDKYSAHSEGHMRSLFCNVFHIQQLFGPVRMMFDEKVNTQLEKNNA